MSNILVVSQYTQLPGEKGSNRGRFKYIAELLADRGHNVTVATSIFRELDKTYRDPKSSENQEAPYDIVLLDDSGYKKTVSIDRIKSMTSFAKSIKDYLHSTNKKFDLIYICVPGLKSTIEAGKFAEKNSIPFILDVQDVWPEAMYALLFDVPVLSNLIFSPVERLANEAYSYADGIMAVSKTYMELAAKRNTKSEQNKYVFIGSFLDDVIKKAVNSTVNKPDNEFWVSYIGSLAKNYDVKTLMDASLILNQKGINTRPVIMGSGPDELEMRNYAEKIGSNALFTGWLEHSLMREHLAKSDAVINAIKAGSPSSITNKVGDYLASGLPMLNGNQNKEMQDLLNEYKFGINYIPENSNDLAKAIEKLYLMDTEQRAEMGKNARYTAEQLFDRKKTYQTIIEMIESYL